MPDSQSGGVGRAGDQHESTRLPSVLVTDWVKLQDYVVPKTATATGTSTALADIPLSIYVIPEALLRDQNTQSLGEAVRNSPGISVNMGEGMRDEFQIRGVKTKSDFFTDGLRDDTEYMRDLYNVAHVDVLEGPAALLFGRGGAGGVINLVTKQAQRQPIHELSIEAGSWQHLRSTLDIGDAIGESAAFRLLAMGEDSGSFRDHYFLHRHGVNPKFSYQLDPRTQIDFGFSYLDDRRIVDRGITSQNGRPVDVPRETFFGAPDQNESDGTVGAFNAHFTHAFNDDLILESTFRAIDADRDYVNTYAGGAVNDDGVFKMKGYAHNNNRLSYIERTDLVATFDSGSIRHTLLLGTEFSWQRGDDYQTLPSPGSKSLPGRFPLSHPQIAPIAFPYLDRNNHVVGKELGLYAQDQISLGESWKAIVGARWDRFSVVADYRNPEVSPDHTYNLDQQWSPRAGLIYKPVENDSIYVSVTQTFTPQGANIALSRKSPEGANLDPEKAINYEIGNKLDLLDGRLSLTAAVFQLNLDDVVSEAADGSGDLVNTGKQRNKGVALSVQGALTNQWSVFANYTHLDARITHATQEADAGAHVGLVPRNQFSLWTRYALTPQWGIAAGLRGESEKYTSYSNSVVLPKYAVADLMAYYQTGKYRIQLNLDNVTDKHYFPIASSDYEIMPGTPRSVTLTLNFNF
ncbi:MAG TPA: TonB-dependent siderophore receptor [Rudaea sp.]|nr:TonB-dependent siderophore receptor [Rudaea sp.]